MGSSTMFKNGFNTITIMAKQDLYHKVTMEEVLKELERNYKVIYYE